MNPFGEGRCPGPAGQRIDAAALARLHRALLAAGLPPRPVCSLLLHLQVHVARADALSPRIRWMLPRLAPPRSNARRMPAPPLGWPGHTMTEADRSYSLQNRPVESGCSKPRLLITGARSIKKSEVTPCAPRSRGAGRGRPQPETAKGRPCRDRGAFPTVPALHRAAGTRRAVLPRFGKCRAPALSARAGILQNRPALPLNPLA